MRAEYINSFYKATQDVFKLMLDIDIERDKLEVVEGMVTSRDASVMIGVTGDLRGSILFSFPKDMALKMIKIMADIEMDELDNFVSSALGEMGNIIGGNALTYLSEENYICDIVPPQIILGAHKSFQVGQVKSLLLTMKSPIGEFDLNIFLREPENK